MDEPKPGHGLQFCRLGNCPHELVGDEPRRGPFAGVCRRCRSGETVPGILYRRRLGGRAA